jgi:hypothetical protein
MTITMIDQERVHRQEEELGDEVQRQQEDPEDLPATAVELERREQLDPADREQDDPPSIDRLLGRRMRGASVGPRADVNRR